MMANPKSPGPKPLVGGRGDFKVTSHRIYGFMLFGDFSYMPIDV